MTSRVLFDDVYHVKSPPKYCLISFHDTVFIVIYHMLNGLEIWLMLLDLRADQSNLYSDTKLSMVGNIIVSVR